MANTDDKKQTVITARARWKIATDADKEQLEREREDLRFLVDHWPADIRTAREGAGSVSVVTGGVPLPPTPARPCIQIDNISEPIARVLNQANSSDINVQIAPADDFGDLGVSLDDTEITLREGLVRRIQRESPTADARTWGYKRGVEAGRGYWVVNVRFLSGSFAREVYVHRIYDQTGVRLDPAHEQPDGSDANWGHIGGWMPWNVYKATYPSKGKQRNRITDASDSEFEGMAENQPTWISAANANKQDGPKGKGDRNERGDAVLVVDYWYAELVSKKLMLLSDGTEGYEDTLSDILQEKYPEGAPDDLTVVDERDDVERKIYYCKIDGVNDYPLEQTEWESPYIPIVKYLGNELHPFDGKRIVQGMIRPARDSQFGLDAMVSKQVETIALAPIPALTVDPEAIDGYEEWYAKANTRTLPFLPSRTYDDAGRQLNIPTRTPGDPNILPIAQSIMLFKQGIESTMSTSDPALGRTDPTVKSAKHAQALIRETEFGTGHFLDNLVRSMRYEGQIINSLLYPVYGKKPGRLVDILTGEGKNDKMRVNPTDEAESLQLQQNQQTAIKVGRLTEHAKCNVIIKVTKSAASRRDQETTIIGEMIAASPELITWFGDLFFANQDGPGHQQMAERAKVMLAPAIQKYLADKEQGKTPIPPQLQAEMAQMQERLQMAEQALQMAAKEREGKILEQQGKLQTEQLKVEADYHMKELEADRDLALKVMDNAAKLAVAHIAAAAKGVGMDAHAEEERMALAHAHAEGELDRAAAQQSLEAQALADAGAQGADQRHQAGMAGAQAQAASEEAALGREHESALSEQQLAAQAAQSETEA